MQELLNVSEALNRLLLRFTSVTNEVRPISEISGRVLAEDVVSGVDLPLYTNSSMDGFAVIASDVTGATADRPIALKIVTDIPAGSIPVIRIGSQESARIMTGALLPTGADSVVPVEFTNKKINIEGSAALGGHEVLVFRAVNKGDYVRQKGEDIRTGGTVLISGTRLRPQDIGLLAMLGISKVSVFRRPRVALFSTGDELVAIDKPLQTGKIHDSNAYTLAASIARDGGEAHYLGIIPDSEDAVQIALQRAAEAQVDLILSSAGVSVGAFDFVRAVVEKHGKLDFWRVNMRPGKPLAFGDFQGTPFIGLPGNPVSAFVGYEVFVRPALMKLSGLKSEERILLKAKLTEGIESDGRESYLRGVVTNQAGEWIASLTGHQGSGNLLSLVQANALLIIPSGVKSLPSRAEVQAWIIGAIPVGDLIV
jgi:molybdopterin molybdotransferase